MKYYKSVITVIGSLGAVISTALGGWDSAIITLLVFMAVDYITGVFVAIMHKSSKTNSGGLSSAVGFIGLMKKCSILLMVVVAHYIDTFIGADYTRDAVCLTYILNELLSIIENAGVLGLPIPAVIKNGIDILKRREGSNNEHKIDEGKQED